MHEQPTPSFFVRLWMAWVCFWRVLFRPSFAGMIRAPYLAWDQGKALPAPAAEPKPAPKVERAAPEQVHAPGLFLLSMLQREGRLVDFLQEEVAPFSDAEVGAAARVVHEGCRKVFRQYLTVAPVLPESEGAQVQVPAGFDAQRIRLVGNVAGQAPFSGSLKHHGWVATEVKLPDVPTAIDPRIIAPAEVELP